MSLTSRHAHNNSRWWLTPHRKSLYSDIDHLRPANLFVLPDRRKNLRTSTLYAWYCSSFWRNNLIAASSSRRAIETKSGQNRMFDPGGFAALLRPCPFLGTWCALLCGKVMSYRARRGCNVFWRKDDSRRELSCMRGTGESRLRMAVCLCFSAAADLKRPCRRGRLEAIGCHG